MNFLLKSLVLTSVLVTSLFIGCNIDDSFGIDNELPPITSGKPSNKPFRDYLGINAFEWNFSQDKIPEKIDESKFKVIQAFSSVRHYLDWERLESKEGCYTFSVTHSGGWDYDEIYRRSKESGIAVLIDLKGCPNWLLQSYPEGQRDAENIPISFGSDRSDPKSYIRQARAGFQLAARYGYNKNVPPALLTVDTTIRWTNDQRNTVKIGLGYVTYIECDNERDKWWKGPNAQQSAEEYAANLSAFYDGHQGRLGKGVGVKQADPKMMVVMGGLAKANPDFIDKMIKWCEKYRGRKPNGEVNLCFDIINYHLYANDGFLNGDKPTQGIAPELSNLRNVAFQFTSMSEKIAYDTPVWVTETGYDVGKHTPQRAISIGDKSSQVTQADWNLRTALLYARSGIKRCMFYMLENVNEDSDIQYNSSGFVNTDFSRRPAADYFLQVNKLMGNFHYQATLYADPIVDVFKLGKRKIYVLTIPDQKNRQSDYQLDLGKAQKAKIYRLQLGKDEMLVQTLSTLNGKLKVPVSETPIFVEAN